MPANAVTTVECRTLHSVKESQPPFYIGVDVGGTSIKIGLVDDFGNPIETGEINDDGNHRSTLIIKTETNPQSACELMSAAIHSLLNRLQIEEKLVGGIGLGLPATMDKVTRQIRRPPNLPTWAEFAMCDALAALVNYPVTFCNDANAAAYGEYWVGSANGQSSLALLTLGTGIGTGIIIEGKSLDGAIGYGGECGHIIIDSADDALLCGCGQRGHLEAYCSAAGMAKRTLSLIMHRHSSIRAKVTPETRLADIPKLVYYEAEGGDELALEIVLETAKYLAIGIVSLLHTLDPACVLLGGAMTFGGKKSPLGQQFLSQIVKEVKLRAFPAIAENVLIDFAILGSNAGYIGAAGLAREAKK
ncbi:MAG: ROK family protein [Planctomycetaceae bacterium]|jgi:glucokinase|nr:ROK family protein [Planctomycetaceae bacterium]